MKAPLAAVSGLVILASLGPMSIGPAVAAPAPSEPATLYHTHPGDTLEGLAVHYMTGRRDAAIVATFNGFANAGRIPAGATIRIPTRLLKSTPLILTAVSVTGPVSRLGAGGRSTPLAKGDIVNEGDRVSTGANAFATLARENGSRVTLPSHTTLRAAALRRTLLEGAETVDLVVESGRGEMTVTPLRGAQDRFEIRTPASVAAVRGTEFRVVYDESHSVSTLEVVRGRVGESVTDISPPADIVTGQAAQRPLGGERRIVPLLAPPSLLPPDTSSAFPTVTLKVANPVPGQSYHFVLARDPGFAEPFAEATTTDGVARFETTPLAPFSARVTAIDAQGIEGLPKVYLMERAPGPQAPASS